jgi:hypothetical protein
MGKTPRPALWGVATALAFARVFRLKIPRFLLFLQKSPFLENLARKIDLNEKDPGG